MKLRCCNVPASNLIFTSTANVVRGYFDFGFVSQRNLSAHCLQIPPQKWYLNIFNEDWNKESEVRWEFCSLFFATFLMAFPAPHPKQHQLQIAPCQAHF